MDGYFNQGVGCLVCGGSTSPGSSLCDDCGGAVVPLKQVRAAPLNYKQIVANDPFSFSSPDFAKGKEEGANVRTSEPAPDHHVVVEPPSSKRLRISVFNGGSLSTAQVSSHFAPTPKNLVRLSACIWNHYLNHTHHDETCWGSSSSCY